MTTQPLTAGDLSAIERGIEAGDLTHGQVHQLIAEVRRQMDAALSKLITLVRSRTGQTIQ